MGCVVIVVLHIFFFLLFFTVFHSVEVIGGDLFRPFPAAEEWLDHLEAAQEKPEEIRIREDRIRDVSYLLEKFFLFFEAMGMGYYLLTKKLSLKRKIGVPLGVLIVYLPIFVWIKYYAEFYFLYMKRLPGLMFCLVLTGYLLMDRKRTDFE
ncbi:MAG: hypothetical protein HFI93_03020 [Lachnospiraceae bacterium]|nr:hypothetical protein [Lachnospiraceae bacterium]